ncbi:hypothetical protein [Silvibacterium sp.]|uniref:hypothetical protein n=1 Tax=Silvibacterium sp. TaxID=1964179 RepID=UPI0039E41928
MRFSSVLLAGGAMLSLCTASFAQTASDSASTAQNAQTTTAAPATSGTPSATQTGTQSNANTGSMPSLHLQDLPADPHTLTPEEKAQQEAEMQRVRIQQVAMAMNKWGPEDSTPGNVLTLKEIGRTKAGDATQITYQLQATGFTPDTKLSLLRWPLNSGIVPVMDGVVIQASGVATCDQAVTSSCTKLVKPGAPVEITVSVAKGEAVRLALSTLDKKRIAAAAVVPFPLRAEDHGCSLEVIRGAKDDELVLIKGEGFKNATDFNAGSESFGEKHAFDGKPTPDGHIAVAITPWVHGHDAGDTVIYAQTPTCSPTLSFHWGKDTYKVE